MSTCAASLALIAPASARHRPSCINQPLAIAAISCHEYFPLFWTIGGVQVQRESLLGSHFLIYPPPWIVPVDRPIAAPRLVESHRPPWKSMCSPTALVSCKMTHLPLLAVWSNSLLDQDHILSILPKPKSLGAS
jgi:hypothetical protein